MPRPTVAGSCSSSPRARCSPAAPARRSPRPPAQAEAARPADVGAVRSGRPDQDPEGRDQRLRFRAGVPAERAAGAFRLHGGRHRRRGDAARQPAGFPEVPAPSAPAGRRQQAQHQDRHPRRDLQLADLHLPDRRPEILPCGRRDRRRQGRQGRQPPAGPVERHLQLGRGRDRGARRADLADALRHQQVGGRRGDRHSAPRMPVVTRSP